MTSSLAAESATRIETCDLKYEPFNQRTQKIVVTNARMGDAPPNRHGIGADGSCNILLGPKART